MDCAAAICGVIGMGAAGAKGAAVVCVAFVVVFAGTVCGGGFKESTGDTLTIMEGTPFAAGNVGCICGGTTGVGLPDATGTGRLTRDDPSL